MKLIRTVNSNYVWLLFSSYLFGVIVNLVRFPTNTLFLELGKTSGTSYSRNDAKFSSFLATDGK